MLPSLGALPEDAWHHFYHYQSSAQYLWLAESLWALGQEEAAQAAYDKAVFQDHSNREALEGRAGERRDPEKNRKIKIPYYDTHPLRDAVFCASVGRTATNATKQHDEAAEIYLARHYAEAIAILNNALVEDAAHSNSYFTRGKCWFQLSEFARAKDDFSEAIRLSHLEHDVYHRAASAAHVARGMAFFQASELDVAIADFSKALDLHCANKAALRARADAYRVKGNIRLAELDENQL